MTTKAGGFLAYHSNKSKFQIVELYNVLCKDVIIIFEDGTRYDSVYNALHHPFESAQYYQNGWDWRYMELAEKLDNYVRSNPEYEGRCLN